MYLVEEPIFVSVTHCTCDEIRKTKLLSWTFVNLKAPIKSNMNSNFVVFVKIINSVCMYIDIISFKYPFV